MDKKDPFNLFSAAAKPLGKPKKSSQADIRSSKASDLQEMLSRMKAWHDEINRYLDEIYAKTGLTPKHVKKYLNNPNNFSSHQWKFIQTQRQELLKEIGVKLGKGEAEFKTMEMEKEQHQAVKERKGKTLGARRRWIPMS